MADMTPRQEYVSMLLREGCGFAIVDYAGPGLVLEFRGEDTMAAGALFDDHGYPQYSVMLPTCQVTELWKVRREES